MQMVGHSIWQTSEAPAARPSNRLGMKENRLSDAGRHHFGTKVPVIPERCQGHPRCVALTPELFALDEFGSSHVIGDGTVPPGLEGNARLARANCPEFAVDVLEEGSSR